MRSFLKGTAATLIVGAGLAGSTQAAEILVTNNIAASTTWTANNTYNLQNQIYVLPGATLTIQAGVVVASDVTPNGGGSLAVSKGAKIFVKGTQCDPVIMTSKADVATWDPDASHPTGGDPKTGAWREAANEWGNLTIMGCGYISENATVGNVPTCDAGNVAAMEGLIADFPGDTKVLYGGGDDDDCSGSIKYLSIRYGGRVIGLGDELNGLSLGGIGRETQISHVEIMNNVDDGIEIWGGCVYIECFSIWNVGDDSLDIDQGYRGCIQFGLIVQGYSLDASQGSGVGDNACETDGAEDSDWQPVTTTTIYNVTVVGQPVDGDGLTTWRDNARVQYRNCIFMDGGEALVKFDNLDGDGANGYGFNGTLSWPATWATAWNAAPPHANDCPPGTYKAQFSGMLAEISDSVFFRNTNAAAYTEATAVGVFNPAKNNVLIPGVLDSASPITKLTRGPAVNKGGKIMLPVTEIDPRPANEALTSVATAPAGCFWFPAQFRGGFAPSDGPTWLSEWSAAAAFGFLCQPTPTYWLDKGCATVGTWGCPKLFCHGVAQEGFPNFVELYNTSPNAIAALFWSFNSSGQIPFKGGFIKPFPWILFILNTDADGRITIPFPWFPPAVIPPGTEWWWQYAIQDDAALGNVALSNALRVISG